MIMSGLNSKSDVQAHQEVKQVLFPHILNCMIPDLLCPLVPLGYHIITHELYRANGDEGDQGTTSLRNKKIVKFAPKNVYFNHTNVYCNVS